jgi:hypothetical protein
MSAPAHDVARQRIREKLKSPTFPRSLPSAPVGQLEGRETIRVGAGVGRICNGCDEAINHEEAPIAPEYAYEADVYRFHESCWKIWNEERHRPIRRS